MSLHTECNYCTKKMLDKHAAKRGVEVLIENGKDYDMNGWKAARFSDMQYPSAFFMKLPKKCECG